MPQILECTLMTRNGAEVYETIYDWDGKMGKVVWLMQKPNRPLKDLPGYAESEDCGMFVARVPIPLIHADFVLGDESSKIMAVVAVSRKFDEYWKVGANDASSNQADSQTSS